MTGDNSIVVSEATTNVGRRLKVSADYSYMNGVQLYSNPKAESYYELGQQILYKAAEDYIMMSAGLMTENSIHNKYECERFFRGSLFPMICNIEPEAFIRFLEKQAKKVVLTHTIAKDADGRWYACKLYEEDIPLSSTYKKRYDAMEQAARLNGLTIWVWRKLHDCSFPKRRISRGA